jgi:hypothetical protein
VRVLHLFEREEFFPVLTLFGEGRRAETNLHPLNAAILELARRLHIAEVFISGNRSATKGSVLDRSGECVLLSRLHPGRHQIPHVFIVRARGIVIALPLGETTMRNIAICTAAIVVLAFAPARAYCQPAPTPTQQQPLTVPTVEPVPIATAADIEGSPLFTAEDVKTMLQLLDRIDRIATQARSDKDNTKLVGTSGKSPAEIKVSIDATALDEIRAEVAQLKQILQPPSKPSPPR